MSDKNNTETTTEGGDSLPQGSGGDTAVLGKQVADLTKQLTEAQAKVKELEGSQGGLTTANKQLNEQLSKLQAQFKEAQSSLEAKTGEATNLQTQFEQAQKEIADLTGQNQGLTRQTELFGIIAKNPDYHRMVGSFEALSQVIKPDASPEAIESLLKSMAGDAKAQVDQALELFRAGGSPTAGTGGEPTQQGPKDVQEAFTRLQQIAGLPGREQEVASLQTFIQQSQSNTNGGPS